MVNDNETKSLFINIFKHIEINWLKTYCVITNNNHQMTKIKL